MITLSLDSQGSEAGLARLWQEVESTIGSSPDPLEILIAEEEHEFDDDYALQFIQTRHHL